MCKRCLLSAFAVHHRKGRDNANGPARASTSWCYLGLLMAQLPKADLLTFWFPFVDPLAVVAPEGDYLLCLVLGATEMVVQSPVRYRKMFGRNPESSQRGCKALFCF